MDILIACLFLFLSLLILRSLKLGTRLGISGRYVLIVFLVKCLVGAIMLNAYNGSYEVRQKADVYKFFDDGRILLNGILNDGEIPKNEMQNWNRQYDHGFSNDNRFMIVLNAGLIAISFGNIWAVMIIMNLLVIIALFQMMKVLAKVKWSDRWFLYLALTIPSVLIWYSFLLKEPIAIIGIASIISVFDVQLSYVKRIVLGLVGLLILAFIKIYIIVFLIPVLVVLMIQFHQTALKKLLLKYATFVVILIASFIGIGHTDFGQNKIQSLAFKQQDFKNLAEGGIILKNDTSYCHISHEQSDYVHFAPDSIATIDQGAKFTYLKLPNTTDSIYVSHFDGKGSFKLIFENPKSGSIVYVPSFNGNSMSMAKTFPFAWLNTFIRPVPFEFKSVMVNLASIENLALIVLLVISLMYRKKVIAYNLLFATIAFVVLIYTIIGVTTPVLGAIVRYKSIMLPFVWYVCYLLMDFNKIESFKIVRWVKSFVLQEQQQE